MAAESGVSLDEIVLEVRALARDQGLISSKLEGTRLLALAKFPADWSVQVGTEALVNLINEVVSKISNEKQRAAARAALLLDPAYSAMHSAADRWKALAASRRAHADTVRQGWWGDAARTLARALLDRILDLNENPAAWQGYAHDAGTTGSAGQPSSGHYLESVDVAWLLRGKAATELLTYRTLVALVDGLASYECKAWYFSDPDPGRYEVVPLMNCAIGTQKRPGNRGILLTDLIFPTPLAKGEKVFFAYKVLYHTNKQSEPVFHHAVRSDGVDLLSFRVQFDPDALPDLVWHFASHDDAEPYIKPPAGSPRYLTPSTLGYVEHRFHRCQHGTKYGIAWTWPEQ